MSKIINDQNMKKIVSRHYEVLKTNVEYQKIFNRMNTLLKKSDPSQQEIDHIIFQYLCLERVVGPEAIGSGRRVLVNCVFNPLTIIAIIFQIGIFLATENVIVLGLSVLVDIFVLKENLHAGRSFFIGRDTNSYWFFYEAHYLVIFMVLSTATAFIVGGSAGILFFVNMAIMCLMLSYHQKDVELDIVKKKYL